MTGNILWLIYFNWAIIVDMEQKWPIKVHLHTVHTVITVPCHSESRGQVVLRLWAKTFKYISTLKTFRHECKKRKIKNKLPVLLLHIGTKSSLHIFVCGHRDFLPKQYMTLYVAGIQVVPTRHEEGCLVNSCMYSMVGIQWFEAEVEEDG